MNWDDDDFDIPDFDDLSEEEKEELEKEEKERESRMRNHPLFIKANEIYEVVMRNEILEFQKLFREWVISFDTMEHEEYIDEWGLFIRK